MRNCGHFPSRNGQAGRSGAGRADAGRHAVARAGRQRRVDRAGGGAGPSAPVDHRPGQRHPAHADGG
ncbi:hypothetical protein AI27_01440 [Sphingomonas sp. BHC-A]|nr:hypothetical protein AI27_01440 [Sphingomonas sp. BHC-A]